jgi:hypothetical protein
MPMLTPNPRGRSVNCILCQYGETSVMHILFSLLRIKGLSTFQNLLPHPQEALNKRHLVYFLCVMSAGSARIGAAK